jgi:hypothetical protein
MCRGGTPVCMLLVHDDRLDSGRSRKLVARAGEAPQAHAFEAVMCLQVRKSHLNLLALSRDLSNSGVPISVRA